MKKTIKTIFKLTVFVLSCGVSTGYGMQDFSDQNNLPESFDELLGAANVELEKNIIESIALHQNWASEVPAGQKPAYREKVQELKADLAAL